MRFRDAAPSTASIVELHAEAQECSLNPDGHGHAIAGMDGVSMAKRNCWRLSPVPASPAGVSSLTNRGDERRPLNRSERGDGRIRHGLRARHGPTATAPNESNWAWTRLSRSMAMLSARRSPMSLNRRFGRLRRLALGQVELEVCVVPGREHVRAQLWSRRQRLVVLRAGDLTGIQPRRSRGPQRRRSRPSP
jgi:hypothetical protein